MVFINYGNRIFKYLLFFWRNMDGFNHVSLITNLQVSFLFFVPCLIFYFLNIHGVGLLYSFVIILMLVFALTHVKYKKELTINPKPKNINS